MEEELLIGQSLADIFDSPIDQVLTARLGDNDKLQGTVLSDGNIFRYELDEYVADLEHLDSASEELNAWADGYLNAHGIRTDSDLPFSYAMGFLRLDAQVKCKSGGTPCGRRCLPRGQKCRQGTGASGAMVGRAKSGMRRKAALGVGAAALAAGAGAAYLATRKGKDGKSLAQKATEAAQPKKKNYAREMAARAGVAGAAGLGVAALASRRKSRSEGGESEGVEEAQKLLKGSDEMKALPGSAPEPERKALPGSKSEPETKALSGSTSTPKALPPAKERSLPPGKDGRQRRSERINKGTAKGNPNSVLGRATRPRDDDPNPYAKRESPIVTPAPKKKRGRPKKGS